MIDFKALMAPFPPMRVSWRVGSTTADKSRGMALAYIDARDVMERLDEVCGPGGWQRRYTHANTKTVCEVGVNTRANLWIAGAEGTPATPVEPLWVWKADGAGDTDYEAEKGALSDAFKRAAVNWGIGRYLYDLKAPWVAIEARGKSFSITDDGYKPLLKLLNEHYSQWQAANDPKTAGAVKGERENREDTGDAWKAWATGDEARKFYRASKQDIDTASNKADLDGWLKQNSKSINALYDHNREAHAAIMALVNNKREGLTARAA